MIMKISLKQPKIIIPIIAIPFLLFLYAAIGKYSNKAEAKDQEVHDDKLQTSINDVSEQVKNQGLIDKFTAYKNLYKKGDGYSSISRLDDENLDVYTLDLYDTINEQNKLNAIENALKENMYVMSNSEGIKENLQSLNKPYSTHNHKDMSLNDDIDNALQAIRAQANSNQPPDNQFLAQAKSSQADPIALFRQQMAIADSFARAHSPYLQDSENQKLESSTAIASALQQEELYSVHKIQKPQNDAFNTVKSQKNVELIQAIIDENRTAYMDSRLRIRLLEDLQIGPHTVKKGTFLYAKIKGFSAQRVLLEITSLLYSDQILPVALEIHDQDGSAGLYVPASAFREFSRELSSNATQGININTLNNSAGNNLSQIYMSSLQRMFQSTSSALSSHIRKNKAKISYNTLIYLVDRTNKNQTITP